MGGVGQGACVVIYTPVTGKYARARGQAPICLVIGVLKTARSLEENNATYLGKRRAGRTPARVYL